MRLKLNNSAFHSVSWKTNLFRKWLIGFGVLGALLVGFMGQRWLLPEEQRLVFAAGQRGGLYHELAQHLATELQAAHPRLRIEVIETDGSLDNAQRLQNRDADLALLQNDTQAGAQARSLSAIHPELLRFLCHRDAGIQSLHDLAEHTIAVGPKGSGSEQFTRELFQYLGLPVAELNLKTCPGRSHAATGRQGSGRFAVSDRSWQCCLRAGVAIG